MKSELDYNEISQNISELNVHTKKYSKFNHTWNQNLFDLERPRIKTRAGKLIKNIKEQLLLIAVSKTSESDNYFPSLIDTHPSSKASKKSISSKYSIRRPLQHSKIQSHNSLAVSIDELDLKMKDPKIRQLRDVIPEKIKVDERYRRNELFNVEGILSSLTLAKIKDLDEKVKAMRDSLHSKSDLLAVGSSQGGIKSKRALAKLRATHFMGMKKKRNETMQNSRSLVFKTG